MKIGEAFGGNYLKTEQLQGRAITVTIDYVAMEELGQGSDKETKAVIHFVGKDKGLVLNRTNADTITDILGTDETDEWAGQRIVLYPDKTSFQGKRVPCIRIRAAQAAPPPRQRQRPAPQQRQAPPQPEPEEVDEAVAEPFHSDDDADSIHF